MCTQTHTFAAVDLLCCRIEAGLTAVAFSLPLHEHPKWSIRVWYIPFAYICFVYLLSRTYVSRFMEYLPTAVVDLRLTLGFPVGKTPE